MLCRFSHAQLCNPMDRQAPLSMGFSRREYWSELPSPPPRDLSKPGSNPHLLCLLHWQAGSLPLAPPEKPFIVPTLTQMPPHTILPWSLLKGSFTNSLLNFSTWISALPSNPIPTDPYHFIDISLMKVSTFHLYNFLFLFDLPDETVRSLKTESVFSSSYALNKLIVTSCIE